MSNDDQPQTPQEWRELLRARYEYPEETREGGMFARRRARKAYRRRERERTRDWVRAERRREPVTPGGALLIVVAVLAVGLGARFLPGWLGGDDDQRPAAAPSPTAVQERQSDPPASPTAPPSPSPSQSADLSDPEQVAGEWIRHYLTRNPPEDQDHAAPVQRAAPWATPALSENLASSTDPEWDRLVSRGGVATVTDVAVSDAPPRDLPGDTPVRVWRTAKATIEVQGYTDDTQTRTLQVEVTRIAGRWLVSRVLGI